MLKQSIATKSALLTKTNFRGYDTCLNPYVGCQFGCKYCYVRFFVKDEEKEWGDFVRIRDHLNEKLPKEIEKGYIRIANGKIKKPDGTSQTLFKTIPNEQNRLVLGTMTDPYMPIERKHRLTRTALQHLSKAGYKKIGIFTRSPIVLDDLEIIKTLPNARIHYSITPYEPEILHMLEPIAIKTERRWETIKKIKEAGVKVNVNIAPCIPLYSDQLIDEFCKKLAEAKVDEFFLDPIQAYDQSFKATKEALQNHEQWAKAETIILDKHEFLEWKQEYHDRWKEAWKNNDNNYTLPIWCDHVNHVWQNLSTGEALNPRRYND